MLRRMPGMIGWRRLFPAWGRRMLLPPRRRLRWLRHTLQAGYTEVMSKLLWCELIHRACCRAVDAGPLCSLHFQKSILCNGNDGLAWPGVLLLTVARTRGASEWRATLTFVRQSTSSTLLLFPPRPGLDHSAITQITLTPYPADTPWQTAPISCRRSCRRRWHRIPPCGQQQSNTS